MKCGCERIEKLVSTERKTLRMFFSATLRDRISSSEVTERMGVESTEEWLMR